MMASSIAVFNEIGECAFKEFKNIKELEESKAYKIERIQKIKTKYGPSVLVHLVEYKVLLLRRFANKLDEEIIRGLKKNIFRPF